MKYSLSSKLLFRIKRASLHYSETFGRYVNNKMSREESHNLRRRLVKKRGRKIVDRKVKATIKNYCKKTFGSRAYWPWLALYTEMRGEFIEGWIPDDLYRFEIIPKSNPEKHSALHDTKSLDHILFEGKAILPVLLRLRGIFTDGGGIILNKVQVNGYLKSLNCELVIKPDNGRSGRGIIFIHSKDINLDELPVSTDLIFQNVVKQHSSLNEVYPSSVNTFRVTTHLKDGGGVNILFINLRMGTGGSRIDNISRGGIWISIKSNGEVSNSAYDDFGLEAGEHHPDTGYRYSDLKVPYLHKIVAFCEEAHKLLPHVGLIGWDVCVDESGEPVLIEWNANNPWFWDIEAQFGPLWENRPKQF